MLCYKNVIKRLYLRKEETERSRKYKELQIKINQFSIILSVEDIFISEYMQSSWQKEWGDREHCPQVILGETST